MTGEVTVLDPADHLKSDQAITDFMGAALETNGSGFRLNSSIGCSAARRTRLSARPWR